MYCKICGKEIKNSSGLGRHIKIRHSISNKDYYDKYMKKENEGKCLTCGEETTFRSFGVGYLTYCSTKCVNLDPVIRQKSQDTYMKKTGYKHNMYNPESKEKVHQTCLEKYGTKIPIQNEKIKEKSKKTCLEKYGVEYSFQSINNKEKSKKTCLKKYGTENVFKCKEIIEKIKDKNILNCEKNFIKNILPKGYELIDYKIKDEVKLKCDKGHIFQCQKQLVLKRNKANHIVCTVCQPLNDFEQYNSKGENELYDFIKKYYNNIICKNDRKVLNGLELDIYLPELNLAFEFNGLYWHSELFKDKQYHLEKNEKCLQKGIHLIQIYEDDWIYKQEIVKSRILNLLGKTERKIYARKCHIDVVDTKNVRKFLDDNHIQGYISSTINLGLYNDNELVSLMSFGPGRFRNKNIELVRFCNKLNTNVIGGASKLFKHFCISYKYEKIVSYADRSWSNGNLYQKLGFELIKETAPNFYYIVDNIRMNRFKYRKSELIKQGFNGNKTEKEIMFERSLYRIYDSGNLKYEY